MDTFKMRHEIFSAGNIVTVSPNRACFVRLMTPKSFSNYTAGLAANVAAIKEASGQPVELTIPQGGDWYIVCDMNGLPVGDLHFTWAVR